MSVDHQVHCYHYGIKALAYSLEALHERQGAHKRINKLISFKNQV